MELTFLGGTGTVMGSTYLVTEVNAKVLVDCDHGAGVSHLREQLQPLGQKAPD